MQPTCPIEQLPAKALTKESSCWCNTSVSRIVTSCAVMTKVTYISLLQMQK